MFRILGGPGKLRETVKISDPFSMPNVLDLVKEQYEGKVTRDVFVISILEIIEESEWYIGKHNNSSETLCDVVFKCSVEKPEIGDVLINCVAEKAGRNVDAIIFNKNNMTISAICNSNIDQVLINQVMTVLIKNIVWEQFATKITVAAVFRHAAIFHCKIYRLAKKDVLACQDLIQEYKEIINQKLSTPLDKKMVDLAYTFTEQKKHEGKEVIPFSSALDNMNSRYTIIVRSCFYQPGYVFIDKNLPYKTISTKEAITEIFEEQIKYIDLIREMESVYTDMDANLLKYYKTSKKMNDRFENIVIEGINNSIKKKK